MLVLEPGTSAGSAYFVPLAEWIVSKAPGWQVWSVERRENLLEDQSELNAFKHGTTTSTAALQLLPRLPQGPERHASTSRSIPTSTVEFAQAVGHERRGRGPAPRDRRREEGWAARSCSAATRSADRSSPRTRPGTSTAAPGPTTSPGSVYIDGGSGPSTMTARAGEPGAASARRTERIAVAVVRWDHRAVRRAVQRDRIGGRAARSERAVARSDLGPAARRTSCRRCA